jgi:hypothetical protein
MLLTYQAQAPDYAPIFINPTIPSLATLRFAQQKLLDHKIPLQLRAVAYIRICCSLIQKDSKLDLYITSTIHPKTPYLHLLSALSEQSPTWWDLCSISHAGYLISSDRIINELLQPLNAFVAQHLE